MLKDLVIKTSAKYGNVIQTGHCQYSSSINDFEHSLVSQYTHIKDFPNTFVINFLIGWTEHQTNQCKVSRCVMNQIFIDFCFSTGYSSKVLKSFGQNQEVLNQLMIPVISITISVVNCRSISRLAMMFFFVVRI